MSTILERLQNLIDRHNVTLHRSGRGMWWYSMDGDAIGVNDLTELFQKLDKTPTAPAKNPLVRFQTGKKGAKLLGLDEREGFRVVLDGRLQVYEATWLDVGMMLTDAEVMMRDTTGKERNAIRTAIRKVEAEVDRARSYGGFQYRETKEETAARLAGRFDLEVGIRGERVEFSFVSDEGRTSFPIPVNRSRFVAEEILRNARIIEEQK